MSSDPPFFVSRALPDLCAWARAFLGAPLPVAAETARAIEALRANEDAVDAHLLAETVGADPLMSLKLMAHVSRVRGARSCADPQTPTAALVLLGIGPFFRAFGPQPCVERHLRDRPAAWQGLQRVLRRSRRTANFALAFAVHRMDPDAAVIHTAALLHDLVEMLLWLHAPALAERVAERQPIDATARSSSVQRELLNIELCDLQQALLRGWHLPQLLLQIGDERHAHSPQVRCVQLAARLARHGAQGRCDAALGENLHGVARLLNLGEAPALRLLCEIDADIADAAARSVPEPST